MSDSEKRGLRPGDVIAGRWKVGGVIGVGAEPGSECDAPPEAPASYVDGRCRCVVCPRCHHHTGNAHQGHYWAYCSMKRGIREFHFCCPDPAYGCELEAADRN